LDAISDLQTRSGRADGDVGCSVREVLELFDFDLSTIIDKSPITIKQTVDLLPIENSFGIISPNIPSQMFIMSKDSKFIFIYPPTPGDISYKLNDPNNQLIGMYVYIYSMLKYNLPVYSMIDFGAVVMVASFIEPIDDGVYSTLTTDDNLKFQYKCYLIGLNPPSNLLNFDSNVTRWKNISNVFLTMYQYFKDNTLIPATTCINIRMDTPPNEIKMNDCRNIPNGTNYIIPKNDSNYTPAYYLTNTPTYAPAYAPTYNLINTPTYTPTYTPTNTPAYNPTKTSTKRPTNPPTNSPVNNSNNSSTIIVLTIIGIALFAYLYTIYMNKSGNKLSSILNGGYFYKKI
jgi:hypothetical protein